MSEFSPSSIPQPEQHDRGTNHEWMEEELRELGQACLERTVSVADLEAHQALTEDPNNYQGSFLFSQGDVPTSPDRVYRQVDLSAIQDLAESGIVRNGASARGEEHKRWGNKVFWHSGEEGKALNVSNRAVIEASREAAANGWVTTADIHGIHAQTPSGEVINILERPTDNANH